MGKANVGAVGVMPTHPLASFARAHRRHTTRTHTGILNKMTAVMKRLIALASLAVILAVSVQADTVTEVLDAAQVGGNDTDSLPQPAAYKPSSTSTTSTIRRLGGTTTTAARAWL